MERREGRDGDGRPLTRRELRRAAEPGATREPTEPAPVDADREPTERVAAEGDRVPTEPPPVDLETWDRAVRWSLRQELPSELPPELDQEDDVRWDAILSPSGDPPLTEVPTQATAGLPTARPWGGPPDDDTDDTDDTDDADDTDDDETSLPAGASAPTRGGGPVRRTDADAAPRLPDAGASDGAELPTLRDLLAARPSPPEGPAESGWQGAVRRLTGGLVAPAPGRAEQRHRDAVAATQRSLDGPRTVVVINPKGGAHKTTATLLIAATFGQLRGGYTLAWDNNETRGTLGWRSHQSRHHNTAVNLLQDLDRFADPGSARVGDLDNYVRSQGSAQFDVLASDEDAASAASIDAFAFRSLHRTLSRFYRIMVVDTGNNMRASNWQAAIDAADQVVLVSTVREDTAQSAAWAVDALRATGHEDLVRRAVTVLSAPAERHDPKLADRLHDHFGRLTRTVVDVPYDASLVAGKPLDFEALSGSTREAWLRVTAAVAQGL